MNSYLIVICKFLSNIYIYSYRITGIENIRRHMPMRMKQSTYYTKLLLTFATWRWNWRGGIIDSCGCKLVMEVRLGSCLGTSEEEKFSQSAFSFVASRAYITNALPKG